MCNWEMFHAAVRPTGQTNRNKQWKCIINIIMFRTQTSVCQFELWELFCARFSVFCLTNTQLLHKVAHYFARALSCARNNSCWIRMWVFLRVSCWITILKLILTESMFYCGKFSEVLFCFRILFVCTIATLLGFCLYTISDALTYIKILALGYP